MDVKQWMMAAAMSLAMAATCMAGEKTKAATAALPANTCVHRENSVYQYYIPEDPADTENNGGYYLWLPPDCRRVNGLFLAPKNMDEQPFLEFSETRTLCRELGLGIIVMMPSRKSPFVADAFPDSYPDKNKGGQKIFNYKGGAVEFLQKLLDRLAEQTGYAEIKYAPVIPMGHSWAGAFPSQAAYGIPDRVICTILLKTHVEAGVPFDKDARHNLNGVPALIVDEQAGPNMGNNANWNCWDFKRDQGSRARKRDGDPRGNPVSRVIVYGGGHCEMPKPLMSLMVKYVREACRRRLPDQSPADGPVTLKKIDIKDGWLVDEHLEKSVTDCAPTAIYEGYKGNRDAAIWYFNETLARECEIYFRGNYERKNPQILAFIDNSTRQPLKAARITIPELADDQTFTVKAINASTTDSKWYDGVKEFGTSTTPMVYSVIMGELEQVGAATFRAVMDRWGGGGCGRTIEADNFGDANCQPSMTSAMLTVQPVKDGSGQKLAFPKIGDVAAGTTIVPLGATTDAGLPVGYYVVYGPAVVEGNRLRITKIPPRAVYPIEVKVGAYQWGRYGDKPVCGAGPVMQTFMITNVCQSGLELMETSEYENDSTLSWRASVGRAVSIKAPQLTPIIPGGNTRLPLKVELRNHSVQKGEAVLEYELSLNQGGYTIAGTGTLKVSRSAKSQEDVLIVHTACTFSEAVTANVETVYGFDVQGKPARQMGLPERNGYFKMYPIPADVGGAGRFDLGNAANSGGGSPKFRKDYMLKDKAGNTFPGWKGPDSIGQPWMMDPSVPELRYWYRGYLKALLDEYAKDVDGFVWDETFYIETNFISYPQPGPAYADRAMMSLVSELTQMVQSYHDRNPDLVFLASDLGRTSYALVANGTYQDSAMEETAWGPSMFANYRNSLWSCNCYPLQHAKQNEIAAEKYGLPQGVSNGWEDNCGPSRMPTGLLDDILRRFTKNVESKRERLRYLTP